MSDERLSRMEDKLDKLSEAVVEMARMKEQLLTVFKRLEHMDAAFKKYDDRVDKVENEDLYCPTKCFCGGNTIIGALFRLKPKLPLELVNAFS